MPVGLKFEWDPSKERRNIAKHGVDFAEASTVLADTLSLTVVDPDHSIGERRYLILGMSHRFRLLVVVHTDADAVIRIISARSADRQERRQYEQRKR